MHASLWGVGVGSIFYCAVQVEENIEERVTELNKKIIIIVDVKVYARDIIGVWELRWFHSAKKFTGKEGRSVVKVLECWEWT